MTAPRVPSAEAPSGGCRPPRRPLLPALAALALGAGLGRAGLTPLAVALAAGVGLLGVLGAARSRAGWPRATGLPWAPPLAALLLAGALRVTPPGVATTPARGRWTADADGGRGALVDAGGGRARLELEPGVARDGEELLLLSSGPLPRPARGPVRRSGAPAPTRALAADELVRLAAPDAGSSGRLRGLLVAVRTWILRRIDGLAEPTTRGLCAALLVGDRARLPAGLADLFTRTGVRHALAISGLHVGLVAALFLWPAGAQLARAWRRLAPSRVEGWLARPAVWRAGMLALFAAVAGGGAPVVRAALALSLAQLAPAARDGSPRRVDALSLWACAAIVELALSPASIGSTSLALSYAATLGLIVGTGPLRRALLRLVPRRAPATTRLGRPVPEWARVVSGRATRFAATALALSLAASLATLPIVWSLWGEWGPVGLAVTPLLVPLLAGFLAAGWALVLLPEAVPGLGALLDLLAASMVALLELADRLPWTPASLPARPAGWLALVAVLGLLALAGRRPILARIAAGAAGVTLLPWALSPARLELHALDVGHGTACVLRAPGAPCFLFDAGSRDRPGVARAAVAPLLRALEVGEVAVVLTHGHRDHGGALPWLVERFPPVAWLGALPAGLAERLPEDTEPIDTTRGALRRFERAGLRLALLRGSEVAGNESSRALVVDWRGERLVLCGDAEGRGLDAMLASGALAGPCELLLLPHHGSDTALLGELLARTRPLRVWSSSSGRPAVADELERRGLHWRAPALHGPLSYPDAGTLSDGPVLPTRARLEPSAPPDPAGPAGFRVRRATGVHPREEPDMTNRPTNPSTRAAIARFSALLPLIGCLAAVEAMAALPDENAPAQEVDERAAERQRVFHLEDGQLLRGKSRWVLDAAALDGGYWEVREGRSWRKVDAALVTSWRDLRDVQKEARRLRGELSRDDHARRAALAEWMVRQGLEKEAVTELERVLRAEPDHDAALAVIQRAPFDLSEFGDPRRDPEGAVRAALAAGESRSAVRRELAVRVMREVADREALQDVLRQSLGAFRHRQRYFATLALRRIMPGQELLPLIQRAAYDPSSEVRAGAAHAMADTGQEGVIVPLVNALGSEDGMLRVRAAESLGNAGFEAAVPALVTAMANVAAQGTSNLRPPGGNIYIGSEVAYVGDYDVEIAQGASIADPIVNTVHSGVVLEARAYGFVEYTTMTEYQTIRQSLKSLTGHDAGRSPDKWVEWYEANKSRFEDRKPPAESR